MGCGASAQLSYALVERRDGRCLAVREARQQSAGRPRPVGLSRPPEDDDANSWVPVTESLESLITRQITHAWLGFFEGQAETAQGK